MASSDAGTYGTAPGCVRATLGMALLWSGPRWNTAARATVWDPYLKQDVDRQRGYNAWGTCRSRTELNLPPLQERGKQQRLTTLYKIVKGHILAMPPLRASWCQHQLRMTVWEYAQPGVTFKDCDSDNIIARQVATPVASEFQTARPAEQYKN